MVEVKIFNDGELVAESKGKVVFFAMACPVGHEEADGFSGIVGMTNREELTALLSSAVAENLVEAAGNMEKSIVDAAEFIKRMNDVFPKAIMEKYLRY